MPRAFSNRKPTKAAKKGAAEVLNGEGRKSQIATTASPKLNNRGGGDADETNIVGKLTAKAPIKSRGGGGGRGKKFVEEISEQSAVISASVEVVGKGRKRKADAGVENGSTAKELEESGDINEKISKSRGGRRKVGVENKSETKIKASPEKSPKAKTVRGRGKIQNADIEDQNENVEAEISEMKKGSPKANTGGGRRKKEPTTNPDLNDNNVKDIPTIDENEKAIPPKKRSYSKKSKVEAAQDVEEPTEEEIVESSPPKRSRIDKTPKKPRQARNTKPGGKKVTEVKKNITNKVVSPRGGGRGGNKRNVKSADLDEKADVLSGNKAQEESKSGGRKISGKEKKTVAKTAKSTVKRGAKKTNELMEENEPMQEQAEKTSKRARKRSAVAEPDQIDGGKASKNKKVAALGSATVPLNNIETVYKKSDFDLATEGDNEYNLKISSWNVAGLRSWLKKGGLSFLDYEQPDIFCLQETKCTTDQLPEQAERIPGYHPYWLCQPGGYAGVAIYSKIMPINVEYGIGDDEFDKTGRLITAEYEKFFLVCTYTPNSGRKLVNLEPRMRWEKLFQAYVQQLDSRKPVIICGDMNVSHQEIDLANPKTNTRNAGFTKEEREKMTELQSLGFIDTFRHLYPEVTGAYTFWTYIGGARGRNVGWRLDYFLVSQRFIKRVVDSCIRSQVKGSDHCPITLFLKL